MKNFKILLIALLAVVSVSSCMKNDDPTPGIDYEKERARIDSTLRAQKPILAEWAQDNFENPIYNDSLQMWYEVITPAIDESFEYVLSGYSFVPVKADVKYKGELLDGTVFDETSSTSEMTIGRGQWLQAFERAFWPQKVTIAGVDYFPGLTPKGLQKGQKIRFVAPSPWCYDNKEQKDKDGKVKIPADSPLVFTIEVSNLVKLN
ncbi:FKBP-type peptidyl-prolyl cis-trans isomerase [Sphingobacterium hotanense]|uniref:Peptidyl-prolyl cis-trans isomerase n=1 Tax=Sphingobacterium hotanense TaxID=649196 RepID=A0ABT7NJQ1_9SPHI|nr:FKBP-type peptidyl-prolyl cis-trans isomerase [Sphingobacterium hotanense]MDM1047444.1 FKBP-type peptidyl-prolyl cis-trans isomerase [Sphingobacterium hotanense]